MNANASHMPKGVHYLKIKGLKTKILCHIIPSMGIIIRHYGIDYSEQWYSKGFKAKPNDSSGKTYYGSLRARVIKKMGGKCVKCGFNDPRALQLDHIQGRLPNDKKSMTGFKLRLLLIDSTGFQILCANCNWIKRHEEQEQPGYTYKRLARKEIE